MRLHTHTARTLRALLIACALPFLRAGTAACQTTGARPAPARESKQTTAARAEDARRRAEAREAVVALLETADAARSFKDESHKISVQAEAADALWPFDVQSARAVLRRAWEAANAPGVEDRTLSYFRDLEGGDPEKLDSEGGKEWARVSVLDARRLVIEIALKHDPRTGDAFMREFERGLRPEDSPFDEADEAADEFDSTGELTPVGSRRPDWGAADWQRIYMARQLLSGGSPEGAARAASPLVAKGPNSQLIDFILDLRAADAREADAFYLRLLQATRANPDADANDVLVLSTPVVSPDLDALVAPDGSVRFFVRYYKSEGERRAASSFPAEVRAAFFNTAASVLLRTRAASGRGGGDSPLALYFALGRLLPFFEREAAQYSSSLHARMSALASEVGDARAQSLGTNMKTLSLTPTNPTDPLEAGRKQLAKNTEADVRDLIRYGMVSKAARQELWERARSVAAEMEGAPMRRTATLTIAVYQAMGAARAFDDKPDGYELAADFVRAADVPPAIRAVGLARAAELAARLGKSERAEALFGEALLFAAQAGKDGGERLSALVFVAKSVVSANSARVWELLPALASASNESEEYSGDGPPFSINYGEESNAPTLYIPEEPLKFEDAFAAAARRDFRRALKEARALEDEVTRASVTIAAARAALEKVGKPDARKAR